MSFATLDIGPREIEESLAVYIEESVRANGGDTTARKPSHRVPFHWPPHPISADFHVLASDWSGSTTMTAHGEEFEVSVARTGHGVFGRCEKLWCEGKGEDVPAMLRDLARHCEPLFQRQIAIGNTLGIDGRYDRPLLELGPLGLVLLLYCPNRDVANEARILIETHASTNVFGPALVAILRDQRHPERRIAHWCVLDLFEDLPSFCPSEAEQLSAIKAIRSMIWDAEDDYARTVYKAGVVLGGHVCTPPAAEALLACLEAPSRIGRRSAIHGLFHLAEWSPERRDEIIAALESAAGREKDEKLREFARGIARDIGEGAIEHLTEPVFDDEP